MSEHIRIFSWYSSEIRPHLGEEQAIVAAERYFSVVPCPARFVVLAAGFDRASFERYLAPPDAKDDDFHCWFFESREDAHRMRRLVSLIGPPFAGCWLAENASHEEVRIAAQ